MIRRSRNARVGFPADSFQDLRSPLAACLFPIRNDLSRIDRRDRSGQVPSLRRFPSGARPHNGFLSNTQIDSRCSPSRYITFDRVSFVSQYHIPLWPTTHVCPRSTHTQRSFPVCAHRSHCDQSGTRTRSLSVLSGRDVVSNRA
jgi:hypothetical protein